MDSPNRFEAGICSPQRVTYPSEWCDSDRMSFLLAPFPPSDKPLSLDDSKLSFWSSFILSSSKELRKAVFCVGDLRERFQWKGQTSPSCLPVVLESMEKTGHITKLSDFYNAQQDWLTWGANIVKKPISWALSTYLPAPKYEGEYIIGNMVKELAAAVIKDQQSTALYKSTDNVMKHSDFEELCLRKVSCEVAPILAQQLLIGGQLAKSGTDLGYEVVKVSPVQDGRLRVTDVDIGIVRIKEAIIDLSEQAQVIEEAITSFRQSAKEKLKNKDKKGALRALQRSISNRSLLEVKESMLENLQEILHKIQSAETDAMVFAAYKSGLGTLRSLRDSQGLTAEEARDVCTEIHQLVEEGEEVAAALSQRPPGDDEEDEELLRELEGLMAQDTGASQETCDDLDEHMARLSVRGSEPEDGVHLLEKLPAVPTHPIATPTVPTQPITTSTVPTRPITTPTQLIATSAVPT